MASVTRFRHFTFNVLCYWKYSFDVKHSNCFQYKELKYVPEFITISLFLPTGKGVVYHYDPVGHMEKLTFSAAGASVSLIQPFLDNQVGAFNMQGVDPPKMTKVRHSWKVWAKYVTVNGIFSMEILMCTSTTCIYVK